MKLFKRILSILLLLAAGAVNAQILDTLIDVGYCQLHFKIINGVHAPILFESGGGLDASQWDSIATVVHQRLDATVITYDRSGFGKSSLDTAHNEILQEIKNLELGLHKLGYGDADFILVGHSLGGFYNRVFTARHSNQVKGIVLLDPRIPSLGDMKFAREYFQTLSRTDFEPDYMSLYYLLANMERTSNYVRQVPLPADIPVLDIMAETGPFEKASENERFRKDQRNFVQAGKNRNLLLARKSSHDIPRDQPGLVIDQIIGFYRKHITHAVSSSPGSAMQPSPPGN